MTASLPPSSEQFERFVGSARSNHPQLLVHAANSAATLREPRAHFDMVRCGIAVYGMDPFGEDPLARDLEPALAWRSYLAEVKRCRAGESVGYGRRFIAARDTWIGVLPLGYGDGFRRALSNDCDVLIAGARFPVVGTVSMDNVTVDLGPPEERRALVGAPATIIGRDGEQRITAEELATRLDTINYEITCGISARVPRHRAARRRAGGTGRGRPRPRASSARGRERRRGAMRSGAHELPLALVRRVLGAHEAWLVGGLVRDLAVADAARERDSLAGPLDLDVVVRGDPAQAARELAREARAASFALSEELGAWRVVARDGSWQIDVERLRGETLEEDLRLRDFTVNAVAQTLDGAETFDPLGGLEDLARRRLRIVAPRAFADDPLRVLRLVRLAVNLDLRADPETLVLGREAAPALAAVSPERIFAELRAIIDGPAPLEGLRLMDELGATTVVLPELDALRGVQQSRFHHRDVLGHTLEVLGESVRLARDPAAVLGAEHADAVASAPGASRLRTASRGAARCAGARSSTTSPSRRRAGRGRTGA